MLEIYEALWIKENEQGEIIQMGSFLAQTRYLARHYCGAPEGAKIHICKRKILLST